MNFFYLNVFFFLLLSPFSLVGGWGVGDSFFKHISWTLKSCSHTDQLPFYPQLHLHLPSHSCSLKRSLSHRFLPISSHTGLWNFLSSNFFYPSFVTSFFDPPLCLTVSRITLPSQETLTSSCTSFNSFDLRAVSPLILWQTSAPVGWIHTDVASHWNWILSALWIF